MASVHNFAEELEGQLKHFVISGAEQTIDRLTELDFDKLAKQNPTFAQLASQAEGLLQRVEDVIRGLSLEGITELGVFERVREYAEILDHIAQSIVDFDNKLLIDCIAHLEEFLHLNK